MGSTTLGASTIQTGSHSITGAVKIFCSSTGKGLSITGLSKTGFKIGLSNLSLMGAGPMTSTGTSATLGGTQIGMSFQTEFIQVGGAPVQVELAPLTVPVYPYAGASTTKSQLIPSLT